MNEIIPAIIPQSREHLRAVLMSVRPYTTSVQIDIVDGKFVPFISWPYEEAGRIQDLAEFTADFDIEMDLMHLEPEKAIPQYVAAGINRIVVHLESVSDFARIVALKQELGFMLGISMSNDSPLSLITDHVLDADYVQFMGIAQIGTQQQPFDERVLTYVRMFHERYPEVRISVDGSVNGDTLERLRDAGVNRFISGSAILKSNRPVDTFHRFQRIVSQ